MPKSRYPRRGYPIAPAILRELLDVPAPPQLVDRAAVPKGLRLCDLDETAWDRLTDEQCHELAAEVVRVLGRAARMPLEIGDRRLPAIPEGLTLADLDIEVRTANCLISAGIHERPQDLHHMTIDGALALRGFWVKSLVDLLTSLEYVIDHPDARKTSRTDASVSITNLRAAHRYPRPGHRLAPQALKEVLLDPLPKRLVRGTPFRKARLCDLDETAWDHLPADVIRRLAGSVVARASAAGQNRAILVRRLPPPPKGMRLADLRLENRTHNCLAREGYDRRPRALGQLRIGDLLAFRAFGAKCLVDLLTSLETRIAREGKLDTRLTAEVEALAAIPRVADVPFSDPRLGGMLRVLDTESDTVGEMVRRLLKRRLDPPDPTHLRHQLELLRGEIERLARLPLEEELTEIFAPAASYRDRKIVAAYYGWDGQGGQTLDALGRRHRLSRERIRQICIRAVSRNSETAAFAPVLDRALERIVRRIPARLDRLQAELNGSGIAGREVPIESIHRAAEFLGRPARFEIVDMRPAQLVVDPSDVETPGRVIQAARRAVANFGAARLADVVSELAEESEPKPDAALMRETLETRGDFSWLDPARRWFRLFALPQCGLPNVVDKVLSVTPRIEVAKLRSAIARYRRSRRRLPPARVLLEFCAQMPGIRVEDNTVVSDPPRDWRRVLTGVERAMVGVLKRLGPVLERTEFEEHCIRGGMNRFSFNAIVMCSPVIEQYGRSVYGLIGQKVSRREVKALLNRRTEAPQSRVLRSFGQAPDGRSYLGYRLSKAAISGGVITVPAAMSRLVRGKFVLRTDQGHELGTLVAKKGCGWGLGPALRGRRAQQGDHLLLLFDLDKGEAELQLGDESIIEGVEERS